MLRSFRSLAGPLRLFITAFVLGCSGLLLADDPVPATLPASQPAVAEAAKTVDQLINQLGNDDADDRDSAQKQLVDMGSTVAPDLKKAADSSPDPEIRSRAAAALSQIRNVDEAGASLITVHLKNAGPQDALDVIAAQSHAVFQGIGSPQMPGAVRTVSLDADRQPFWSVMTDLCTQMHVGPTMQLATRNSIQLFPAPRDWMSQSPHQISGAYWIGVVGLYRSRAIDLMGLPRVEDDFSIRLMLLPEPKLAVVEMSQLRLKQARDDAGHSLLPVGPFNSMMRDARQMNHLVESRLSYPENPGKKITVLQGEVTLMLAQDFQKYEADDVLGTQKVLSEVPDFKVRAKVTHEDSGFFRVTIQCLRGTVSDTQWTAMLEHLNDISLKDAGGHDLICSQTTTQMTGGVQPDGFISRSIFVPSIYGIRGTRKMNSTGDAKRLVWNVATSTKMVVVPIEFKDLPMP